MESVKLKGTIQTTEEPCEIEMNVVAWTTVNQKKVLWTSAWCYVGIDNIEELICKFNLPEYSEYVKQKYIEDEDKEDLNDSIMYTIYIPDKED